MFLQMNPGWVGGEEAVPEAKGGMVQEEGGRGEGG